MTANPILNMLGNLTGFGINGGNAGNIAGGSKGGNASAINGILGLMGTLKNSPDPMGAIQSMAGYNPQIKKALDYVNQNGGDMKSAFYKLAEDNGIDANNILNMIK